MLFSNDLDWKSHICAEVIPYDSTIISNSMQISQNGGFG